MKRNYVRFGIAALIVSFLVLTFAGCACFKKTTVKEETAVKAAPAPVKKVEPAAKPAVKPAKKAAVGAAALKEKALREKLMAEAEAFQDIYFDFDRYDLKPASRDKLSKLGNWLLAHPDFNANIEGHCDDRGTAEYNLALGERRAAAAKGYLVKLGVPAARVNTISYGEEMPVDPGQNEEAWTKNRRDHFVVYPTTWKK